MNAKFKSLVAAAAFIATQAAWAEPVTITAGSTPYKGITLTGQDSWALNSTLLSALNLIAAQGSPEAPSTFPVTTQASNPSRYVTAKLLSPVSAVVVESTTDELLSVATSGGLSITTAGDGDLTNNGGKLTLSNLEIDLVNKVIHADVQGANGVITQKRLAFWTFASSTVAPAPVAPNATASLNLSGMAITSAGFEALALGIGLNDFGRDAMGGLRDYGTMVVNLQAAPAQLTTCTVDFATKAGTRAGQLSNTVTVRNITTSPSTGWAVQWQYPQPVIVSSVRNATVTRSTAQTFTAKPVKANTTIAANSGTTFTFNTFYAGTAPAAKVLSATVAGQGCGVIQR